MRCLPALLLLLALPTVLCAQKEYGFDNRKPSGQPYLSPEETVKRMKVPPGFSVKLFAAEPLMTNPIAMTIDAKGRVWIIESFEYPKRTPKGKAPRDRIVILEDTNGDGIADKRTVFAEGKDFPITKERSEKGLGAFDMASGLEVTSDGCYVGAPPYLWHIKGKDKAESFEIVASGFGSQDTHETLNTFTWGPDGWLYGLHGVFTVSKVKSEPGALAPGAGPGEPIDLDAGVWRYHPRTKKFEIFAEGTSNPWGMDFNSQGECFICACVIPHLYHIVPGGIYIKQGGKPSYNQYAYGALKEICDHTFHKESGWAHAGLLCLDAPHIPKQYQNSVIFGSIHGCSIKRNTLKPNGSTFTASRADDFLVSGDKNFRPIQMRWAPDGSILVSDWHDQNPCHQTSPDDWDYERGRIYRIEPPTRVDPLSKRDNPYRRKLFSEFQEVAGITSAQHHSAVVELRKRISIESKAALSQWVSSEQSAVVLREIASALAQDKRAQNKLTVLEALYQKRELSNDVVFPFLVWLALEPEVLKHSDDVILGLVKRCPDNELLARHIIPRVARRLASGGTGIDLQNASRLVVMLPDDATKIAALTGIAEALRGRSLAPPPGWDMLLLNVRDNKNSELQKQYQRIAASVNDTVVITEAIKALGDVKQTLERRREAITLIAAARPPEVTRLFETIIINSNEPLELRTLAASQIALSDTSWNPAAALAEWKEFPQPLRNELVNTLRSRKNWAKPLLEALANKTVNRSDFTDNTALAIRKFNDNELNALLDKHYGTFRDSPDELKRLISKYQKEFGGSTFNGPLILRNDNKSGKAVFAKHCAQCHKFNGQGHDVGPNLDGAERSTEYLLVNIVDPNRVVGTPYFARTIVLKNGRIVTGILAEEDATTIRLKRENAVIEVIVKADIEEQSTSTKSLMPEGLPNNMTIQELRDLIGYLQATPKK